MKEAASVFLRDTFNRFTALNRPQKRVISVASDLAFLLFSLWAAFSLRLETLFVLPDIQHTVLFAGTGIITIFLFIRLGLYRAVVRYMSERALVTILLGVAGSALTLIAVAFSMQLTIPRSVPVLYGALAFLFVTGTRFGVRSLLNRPNQLSQMPVLIVGAGQTGLQLASALTQGSEYRPAAFISLIPDNHRTMIDAMPVYSLQEAERAVRKHRAERILLAIDPAARIDRQALLDSLESLPLPVQTVPSMSELVTGKATISDVRDLELDDLLGREPVQYDTADVAASLHDKVVMVTGAGGSIGSELCRQIIQQHPADLLLFEQSEYALYAIKRELYKLCTSKGLPTRIHGLLGSVTHRRRVEATMRSFGVQTVYHAAAYKHVPLVEENLIEGVQNNVFGTWHTAEAAVAANVERFVLVSTDKAVRPTNIMGATKRLAELVLQSLALRQSETIFSIVRFGNVLGSSGSVVPLFREQINHGGPVTVTHRDVTRYFMSITEASQLVLQAGAMGEGGDVFVLDMGKPVRIAELARKMIRLMGLTERTERRPHGDIEIIYTGLRPGEKLYEELLTGKDPEKTRHSRIMMARETTMTWPEMQRLLDRIMAASRDFNCEQTLELLRQAPLALQGSAQVADLLWCVGDTATGSSQTTPVYALGLE